jgi:hypothetical protein
MRKGVKEPVDASRGFEQSDLSVHGITKGVIYFFVFTAICGALAVIPFWFMGRLGPMPQEHYDATRRLPPEPYPLPQNNITVITDMWNLRGREYERLEGFGRNEDGTVHIPIELAMDVMTQRTGGRYDGPAPTGVRGAPDSGITDERAPAPLQPDPESAPGHEVPPHGATQARPPVAHPAVDGGGQPDTHGGGH